MPVLSRTESLLVPSSWVTWELEKSDKISVTPPLKSFHSPAIQSDANFILTAYWAVTSRHWINGVWQVGGTLDDDAKFTADTSAGTSFGERSPAGKKMASTISDLTATHSTCGKQDSSWEQRDLLQRERDSRGTWLYKHPPSCQPYPGVNTAPSAKWHSHAFLNSRLAAPLKIGFRASISQKNLLLPSSAGVPIDSKFTYSSGSCSEGVGLGRWHLLSDARPGFMAGVVGKGLFLPFYNFKQEEKPNVSVLHFQGPSLQTQCALNSSSESLRPQYPLDHKGDASAKAEQGFLQGGFLLNKK